MERLNKEEYESISKYYMWPSIIPTTTRDYRNGNSITSLPVYIVVFYIFIKNFSKSKSKQCNGGISSSRANKNDLPLLCVMP